MGLIRTLDRGRDIHPCDADVVRTLKGLPGSYRVDFRPTPPTSKALGAPDELQTISRAQFSTAKGRPAHPLVICRPQHFLKQSRLSRETSSYIIDGDTSE